MKRIGDDDLIVGCGDEWSERVSALATGAPLSDAERAAVEAHVVRCAACREHAERLDATLARLEAARPALAAPAFDAARRDAVLAAAKAASGPGRRRWLAPGALAAAALLVAATIGATVFWMRLDGREAAPEETAVEVCGLPLATLHFDGGVEHYGLADGSLSLGVPATSVPAGKPGFWKFEDVGSRSGAGHVAFSEHAGFEVGDLAFDRRQPPALVPAAVDSPAAAAANPDASRMPALRLLADSDVTAIAIEEVSEILPEETRRRLEALGYTGTKPADPAAREGAGNKALREMGYIGANGAPRDAVAERAAMAATAREAVRQYLKAFERLPGERPRDMFYRFFGDNAAVSALEDPLSTFAIDVDGASYTLARASLVKGILPSRYAIRTEEFVNYFPGEVPSPRSGVFAVASDVHATPFSSDAVLLRVIVKGRDVERADRTPLALTFVVDVSGSMEEGGRLELVKRSLRLLVNELDERDTIALVSFASEAVRELPATSCGAKDAILDAIERLSIRGGTNTFEGLLLGYATASEYRLEGGMNRVILCSDGVANEGETSVEKMLEAVREHRENGIFVNTIGVGMGHVNDALLEQFANQGDGICHYVDDLTEARRVFVTQLTGTLETIAKDVKIQVTFDPNAVATWRQLGYENRAVADEDFRNDAVDGGEVGAGHEVVALYEVVLAAGAEGRTLGKVNVRWKDPESGSVSEIEERLAARASGEAGGFDAAARSFRLHALVAEFAEILRESVWARGSRIEDLAKRFEPLVDAFAKRADVVEAAALVKQAALLLSKSTADDVERRLADDLAQNALLRARLADSAEGGKPEIAARIAELEKAAKEIESKLGDRLLERLTGAAEADVNRLRGLGYAK